LPKIGNFGENLPKVSSPNPKNSRFGETFSGDKFRSHWAVGAAVHFGLHRLILGAIITLSKETEEPFLRKALKTAREMRAAKEAELVAAT
jgi:hypothetical protein